MRSIVIVGCGLGGVAMAIALKRAGIASFTNLERAADVGGVWRDNHYPGAGCDVPARLYSYSFERNYQWSSHFPDQAEILGYIRYCVAKYDVGPHIKFNASVARAAFDAAMGLWRIETADGASYEANVLISAVGLFNRPIIPKFPGQHNFRGVQFHSAQWDHGYNLTGRTVAVIGTGASAIQFVPAIAPRVRQLYVFQRTPQYVLPRKDAFVPPESRTWLQRAPFYPLLERLSIFLAYERGGRRRHNARLRGLRECEFRVYLEKAVPEQNLRRQLTPDYPLGCKRLLYSNKWYATLQRPSVRLVDTPVLTIVPRGVRTRDGTVYSADAIIYGTGFAPTDFFCSNTNYRPFRQNAGRNVAQRR